MWQENSLGDFDVKNDKLGTWNRVRGVGSEGFTRPVMNTKEKRLLRCVHRPEAQAQGTPKPTFADLEQSQKVTPPRMLGQEAGGRRTPEAASAMSGP